MKKTQIITILLLFISLTTYTQSDYRKLADSLKYVHAVPYIENCYDPVLWKIVGKGKDIIPDLIDKMSDTTSLKEIYVPFFPAEYSVADVAYIAIQEIMPQIPTFELLGVDFDEHGCGYCSYWHHLNKKLKNRKKFQTAVSKWYDYHKDHLVWVKDNNMSRTGDCERPMPLNGHYEVRETDEDFLAEVFLSYMTEKSSKVYIEKECRLAGSLMFDSWSDVEKYPGSWIITDEKFDVQILKEFVEYSNSSTNNTKNEWDRKAPPFWSKKYKNLAFVSASEKDWSERYKVREISRPAFSKNRKYATVVDTYYNGLYEVCTTQHIYRKEDGKWIEVASFLIEIS